MPVVVFVVYTGWHRHWPSSWSRWTGRLHRKQSRLSICWTNGVRWTSTMLWNCCHHRLSTQPCASTL